MEVIRYDQGSLMTAAQSYDDPISFIPGGKKSLGITGTSITARLRLQQEKERRANRVPTGNYSGDLKNGIRSGRGSYEWRSGQKYEGQWRDDERHGTGTETWPDGRKYFGEWKEDSFHGEGTYTWADGWIFRGTFDNYCPVKGELVSPDMIEVYKVVYDGLTPIFDGSRPIPLSKHMEDDHTRVMTMEDIEEMLVRSKALELLLRERVLRKQVAEETSASDQLFVDEIKFDEPRASMDARYSLEVGRRSQESSVIGKKALALRSEVSGAPSDLSSRSRETERGRGSMDQGGRRSLEVVRPRNSIEMEGGRRSLEVVRGFRGSMERKSLEMTRSGRASSEMDADDAYFDKMMKKSIEVARCSLEVMRPSFDIDVVSGRPGKKSGVEFSRRAVPSQA